MSDRTKHLYELDDGEQYLIVAHEEEEALRAGREDWSVGIDDPEEPVEVKLLPEDREVRVVCPDDPPDPEEVPKGGRIDRSGRFPAIVATAAQWAASEKAGWMIGCSVY